MNFFRKKKKVTHTPNTTTSNSEKEHAKHEQHSSFVLTEQDIALNLKAKDKADAIQQLGDFLIARGKVSHVYKQAMLQREQEVSTYLINGVAIPHGVREALADIKKNSIFVGQFPEGVKWNDTDTVYLACALASKSDEHLHIIQRLTMLIQDKAQIEPLFTTTNKHTILDALQKDTKDIEAKYSAEELRGIYKTIMFTGENGMHERPATLLAKMAQSYPSTVLKLHANNKTADIKSMPSLLILGISPNTELTISAEGPKQDEALEHILHYIENELNHEKAVTTPTDQEGHSPLLSEPLVLTSNNKTIKGINVSIGIACNPVHILESETFVITNEAGDRAYEQKEFQHAVELVTEELQEMKDSFLAQGLKDESAIADAHLMKLTDSIIHNDINSLLLEGKSAVYATHTVYQVQIEALEKVNDSLIQERIADTKDVRARLLRHLDKHYTPPAPLPKDKEYILVAEELTPSQMSTLHHYPVTAICTVHGGLTSHMSILARALGLPAIVGLGSDLLTLESGQTIIADARSGIVICNPSKDQTEKALSIREQVLHLKEREEQNMHKEATTKDGVKIEVVCNIANIDDAKNVQPRGGEGVGLFRTEFMFESSPTPPSVDEQYDYLCKAITALGNVPLTIRMMDIGGDKPVSWIHMDKEDNPFLGIRGIRLLLKHKKIFTTQLEAIYRAALWQQNQGSPVTIEIMFPMITRTIEFDEARSIAKQVQKQIGAPDVKLGVMIETPAAVLIANHLAHDADFFSIGTNDLIQYTFAMDRTHPELSKEVDGLHPSLLKLIDLSVQGAKAHNIHLAVCGAMPSNPLMLISLIAMGVKTVSVSPASVPSVKYLIRYMDTRDLETLRPLLLSCTNAAEAHALCDTYFREKLSPNL